MPASAFNDTTDAVCAFLNLSNFVWSVTWNMDNLTDALRTAWDLNATWAERTLLNPPVRQYQMAKCNQEFQLFLQSKFVPSTGRNSALPYGVGVTGLLACFSACFKISLILLTIRHIKEHKVCNWLLAFDALCQLLVLSLYLVNFFAWLFRFTAIEFRICMVSIMANVAGMYGTMMTIYLISLERMLLTLTPIWLNQLQTPKRIRLCSMAAVCLATAFGFYMSCATLLYVNSLNQFNFNYDGILICMVSVSIRAINSTKGYVLLLLALLDYAVIFAILSWRYFFGVTSGESVRRVLRAVFALSLVVVAGWLLWACNDQISIFGTYTILWAYRVFLGIDAKSATRLDSFYNIANPVMAVFYWLSILASAGGPPILYISSTEYRQAYKKMFGRARITATQVAPAFIQQRYEHGITTLAARDTTVVERKMTTPKTNG